MIHLGWALVAILCVWQQSVYGYIDPGSGSAIMSAIIGFFVAAGMVVKTYWYKLKSFFTAGKGPQDKAISADSGDDRNSS